MITIKSFFGHIRTVLIHKYYVFYYCCKFGIPWRGIVHDISKFSPIEFWESVKYFNNDGISPIIHCKKVNGWSKAWQHHKGRNTHHYEYWIDNVDKGGTPIPMPYKDVVELICDYLSAGKTYNGSSFSFKDELDWWNKKKETLSMSMHPATKEFISYVFENLAIRNKLLKPTQLKIFYLKYNNEC